VPSRLREFDERLFGELVDEGRIYREIARIMKVSLGTVGRKRTVLYPGPAQKEEANPQQEKGTNGGEPPVDSEQMMKQDQALVTMVPTNRPLMEAVIKNMSWWQQAVQGMGWRAIFLAKLKRYQALNFSLYGGSDMEPPLFYLLVEQPLRQGTDLTSRVDVIEMKWRVGLNE